MVWSIRPTNSQLGSQSGSQALEQRLLLLERRLALVEQKATSPSIATSDFVAHEGETVVIQAPTAGLTVLLPGPTATNRGAVIRLLMQNINPVKLRCVSGTVNGQASLVRTVVGAYAAVSDGSTGWWLESLNLPRARDAHIKDYFCSGTTTSGSIGNLGWNLLGAGTPAITVNGGALNSSSKITITTSGAANDRTTLCLGTTESGGGAPDPQDFTFLQCAWNFNNVLTNKSVFFGLSSNFASAHTAVADALGFLYSSAVGANYLLLARAGSAGSPVDSGVAVPANSPELLTLWQQTPGVYRFYVGSKLIGTLTGNTIIPNVPLNCGFRLETLTAATKNMRIGYFGMRAMGLTGALDDDPFLAD